MSKRRTIGLLLVGIVLGAVLTVGSFLVTVLVSGQRVSSFSNAGVRLVPIAHDSADSRRGTDAMDMIAEPHRWLVLDPQSLSDPIPAGPSAVGFGSWVIAIDSGNRAAAAPFANGLSPNSGYTHISGSRDSLNRFRESEGCLHLGMVLSPNNLHHGQVLIAIAEPDCDASNAEVISLRGAVSTDQTMDLEDLNTKLAAFAATKAEPKGEVLRDLARGPSLREEFTNFTWD